MHSIIKLKLLQSILAKAFIPVAYLIGIDPDQCETVGELIATKAVINEFVAYRKLGAFKQNNMLSVSKNLFLRISLHTITYLPFYCRKGPKQ